jgi:O-antigen/teichoic acid export membrane protein
MVGLALVAKPMISLILTEKWLPSVPILQIYCIVYAFRPLLTANIQAIKGLGHGGTLLKVEVLNKGIGLLILGFTMWHGVLAITWGVLIGNLCSLIIFTYPNKKFLKYTIKEQIQDIFPSLLLSGIMGLVVFAVSYIKFNSLIDLIIQVSTGVVVFISLALLSRNETFLYLISMIRGMRKNKNTVR